MRVLFVSVCVLTTSAYAEEPQKNAQSNLATQDLLALTAMLIKDGVYERALKTLDSVDNTQEGLDLARFYTLLGMAKMGIKDHAGAIEAFKQAVAKGQNDPMIYVYLAEAHYALKDYQATLAAIAKTGNQYKKYSMLMEMKAQAHWLQQQPAEAWETLSLAQTLFPNDNKFLERQVFYALDLGLNQQAVELGQRYLARASAKPEDYVAIGNALRLNRQFEKAADILEGARLRYPAHATIAKVLAHTYLDQGMLNTAAGILEETARYHPEFIAEAAEVYKNAGRLQHALLLNAQVADQAKKLKQRLAILLGLKHYEMILNMESNLSRLHILDDQSIRYALAYAAYSIGDFERAKRHLTVVKEPGLFKQATELQRLMQACEAEKWACS